MTTRKQAAMLRKNARIVMRFINACDETVRDNRPTPTPRELDAMLALAVHARKQY